MTSVVFWPGVGGGTEWYRCRTPGQALQRQGWDVSYVTDTNSPIVADVVVLQRVLREGTPQLIERLRALGVFVVYDIDDWYDGIPDYNPARVDQDTLDLLHRSMQAADLISCSTLELAEGYSRYGPTVVLPNYLDPDVWPTTPQRTPSAQVRVGWMGTFRYRADDLALLKPWVKPWLARHPEVVFVAAGCPQLLDYLGVGGQATPDGVWDYHLLPRMVANIDIGLAPLAFNRFNQAKSWVKGLEYTAGGAACVASPSREYRQFIRPGVNGLYARPGQWERQLDTILDDLPTYQANALRVAREHVIDDHIHKWVDAWQTAKVSA